MRWKVANELQGAAGIEWSRQYFSAYDLSECEWITVKRGDWDGYSVKGRCHFPNGTKSGLYRLNCSVNNRPGWPGYKYQRVSPLYINEDGTWPPVPEGHIVGQWFIDETTGREWQRLYRKVPLFTEDEALTYIIAHEMYHYLRRTRQIEGKNTEIEADAFGMGVLMEFRGFK